MVSDSTLKTYNSKIALLDKAKVDLNDKSNVVEWFDSKEFSISSRIVYLCAIKHKLEKLSDELEAYYVELVKTNSKASKNQTPTESQSTNVITLDELLTIQKQSSDPTTRREWLYYVLISLYTVQPPVRADYGQMRVELENVPSSKCSEGNVLVWGKEPYFVFRKYKTSYTYGTVHIPVSDHLKFVLTRWFNYLKSPPMYLLDDNLTSNALCSAIADAFKNFTNKNIGVNILRHAYITGTFSELKTIKQKEDLAKMMLHSKDTQERYNFVD